MKAADSSPGGELTANSTSPSSRGCRRSIGPMLVGVVEREEPSSRLSHRRPSDGLNASASVRWCCRTSSGSAPDRRRTLMLSPRPGTELANAGLDRRTNTLSGSSGAESLASIMTIIGTCHGFARDQSRIAVRHTGSDAGRSVVDVLRVKHLESGSLQLRISRVSRPWTIRNAPGSA